MRSRGANVADIAILVVACDDGFKPQTKEALEHILEAKIPFVVAATKTDLQSASIDLVKQDLEKNGVKIEGHGGDVSVVEVSARLKKGLDELLVTIGLVGEIHGVGDDFEDINKLQAVIIETGLDKRGPLASVVVRNGTISVGDVIVSDGQTCRVRGLYDDRGKQIKQVTAGFPAMILGFEKVPSVGAQVSIKGSNSVLISSALDKDIPRKVPDGEIAVIIKAQSAGALEAVLTNIPSKIFVVESSVGDVKENDIFMAKTSKAVIFSFESKTPAAVVKSAETEGVKIYEYKIIYELFQKMEELIKGGSEEITAKVEIVASFPFNNKKIAGCKVIEGKMKKSDNLVLSRNNKRLGAIRVVSMKKDKKDTIEVGQGEEFGILFEPQLDFMVGDVILSIRK